MKIPHKDHVNISLFKPNTNNSADTLSFFSVEAIAKK